MTGHFVETLVRRSAGRIARRDYIEKATVDAHSHRASAYTCQDHGRGLLFHGVDASVSTSEDCSPSRALALDLYNDFPRSMRLAYRLRHYALFNRVPSKDLIELPSHLFEDNRTRVDELVQLHRAVLDSSTPI